MIQAHTYDNNTNPKLQLLVVFEIAFFFHYIYKTIFRKFIFSLS
jgi:hypothetical protein